MSRHSPNTLNEFLEAIVYKYISELILLLTHIWLDERNESRRRKFISTSPIQEQQQLQNIYNINYDINYDDKQNKDTYDIIYDDKQQQQ